MQTHDATIVYGLEKCPFAELVDDFWALYREDALFSLGGPCASPGWGHQGRDLILDNMAFNPEQWNANIAIENGHL